MVHYPDGYMDMVRNNAQVGCGINDWH